MRNRDDHDHAGSPTAEHESVWEPADAGVAVLADERRTRVRHLLDPLDGSRTCL